MPSLRCENLCKSFGGTKALDALTMNIPSAKIVAIVGPNGAGKTTFINVISGFLGPDDGRCFLGKREITHTPPHKINKLGIARTFQDLRLLRMISVIENVTLAYPNQLGERLWRTLTRFGVAAQERTNRERATQLLEFVGLLDKADQPAGNLSYGQQKLLSLACCLATDAGILILDEPIAGVHPELAMRILGLLEQLRDAGKLIVFVEHDMAAVKTAADLVCVMDDGKLLAQGIPNDVLERPEIMEAFVA